MYSNFLFVKTFEKEKEFPICASDVHAVAWFGVFLFWMGSQYIS